MFAPRVQIPGLGLTLLDDRYLNEDANLSDLANVSTARDNLGLGSMALEDANDYYTAAEADALFLTPAEGDALYQPLDATLTSISLLGSAADRMIYTTGIDTWAESPITAFARSLIDDVDAATARTTLGLVAGGAGDIWVEKAGDTMSGDLIMSDNIDISFGSVADLRWDTTDANANIFKLNLPSGGAVDVPVFAMGVGLSGVDLALFNGTTQTRFALFNSLSVAEYLSLSYNDTSGFGGTAGVAEIESTGDFFIRPTGSLAGTAGLQVNPPTGSTKDLRVVYRGGVGGICRFEFGEQGSSSVFFFTEPSFDQSGFGLTTLSGRQLLIADSGNWTNSRDFDIPLQDNPIFGVQSALSVNTDHSEVVTMSYLGLRAGYVSNAAWTGSSFAMETDRAVYDFTLGAVNAFVNASNTTNKNGPILYIRGGNGNTAHTSLANGGPVYVVPGKNDTGGGGVDGFFAVWHPDEGANDYALMGHDATDAFFNWASGAARLFLTSLTKHKGRYIYEAELATTTATTTTLLSIGTTSDTVYTVMATVNVAQSGGTNTASYVIVGTFENDSGTLVQVGATTNLHAAEDTAGWDATFDVNGTNIRVRVVSTAVNLQWGATATVDVTTA